MSKELLLLPYTIVLDETTGQILQIRDENHSLNLHGSIWNVETADGSVMDIRDMESVSWTLGKKLTICWKSPSLRVKAVFFCEDGLLKSCIAADSAVSGLNRVRFPIYEGIEKLSKEDDYALIPFQNGFLIKNPVDTLLKTDQKVPFWMGRGGRKYENEYPAQYSYQCFAYYHPESFGYYFSCDDGNAYIKTIGFHESSAVQEGLDMVFTNYPENMGTVRQYVLPYNYVFCFFHGDWQTAAKLYRKWAVRQKWYTPLQNRDISRAVSEIDFVRINHEHYDLGTRSREYIETCRIIRDRLNCRPAMHWYGWNKAEKHGDWYPEMADYSNREWHDELLKINDELDDLGILKIPYVNVHLWDNHLKSFQEENAREVLVVAEDGEIRNEPWGSEGKLYAVCHACGRMQNKVQNLLEKLTWEDGFDGIYIDQVASFNATLCFGKDHGHPIGGGRWWSDAYHTMIGAFRGNMPEGKILTTESCCECYHDLFDMFLILDTCSQDYGFHKICGCENVESIPLFAMIYKDSAIAYGSSCKLEQNDEQFRFNYIRNILWGMIPTAEGMELAWIQKNERKMEILKQGVDFFKENRDILLGGIMEESLQYADGEKEIVFGRFRRMCPGVIGSVYQYEGKHRAMLYNFSEQTQTVNVRERKISVCAGSFAKFDF